MLLWLGDCRQCCGSADCPGCSQGMSCSYEACCVSSIPLELSKLYYEEREPDMVL